MGSISKIAWNHTAGICSCSDTRTLRSDSDVVQYGLPRSQCCKSSQRCWIQLKWEVCADWSKLFTQTQEIVVGFFCTCFMLLKRGEHFLKRNCKKESALLFSPLRTKVLLNSKKLDSNEPGDVHLPFGTVNICVSDFSAAADYALPANHLLMISHLVLIICRLAALTTVSQITRFI